MSHEETRTPPAEHQQPYAPTPAAPPPSGTSGWLIAIGVGIVLALGGLAAAIISKGDSGATKSAPAPSVSTETTTVRQSTTVTTTAAPTNVTVAPNVTLAPDGTPAPEQGGGQTSTAAASPTTTTP